MADNDETNATPQPRKAPARRAPRKSSTAKSPAQGASAAAKPARRQRKPAAEAPAEASAAPKSPKRAAPAKPRAAGRAKPPAKRAPPKAGGGKKSASEKGGRNWTRAALVGGLATVGAAATAALLSLRGSTPRKEEATPASDDTARPDPATASAHQPDGTDSSKSFKAGIADENTIPD